MDEVRHPGVVLRDDFMAPLGLGVAELAELAGMSKQRVYELIAGKRGVTVDTALRLGRVFRMRPRHWLAFQAEWDLCQAEPPEGVRQADLAGHVSGPCGILPLPERPPPPPVDMSFPPDMAEAVRKAAEILRPFKKAQ